MKKKADKTPAADREFIDSLDVKGGDTPRIENESTGNPDQTNSRASKDRGAPSGPKETSAIQEQDVYGSIWSQFSKDWKVSRSKAYSNLLQNLTKNAAALVPNYMTAKEHMAMVIEAATNIKGDERQERQDPKDLISSWLRGDMDLSRIPLEGITKQ